MNYISEYPSITCTEVKACNKDKEMEFRNLMAYNVQQVRKGDVNRKKYCHYRLVNGCPIDEAEFGYRNTQCLEPTNKLVLDYDDKGKWKKAWKIFKAHINDPAWGILHFELSVNYGAHITVRRMEGLTPLQNIQYYERITGLSLDHSSKDLSRAIFLVPMSDVLYECDDYYSTKVSKIPMTDEARQMLKEQEEQHARQLEFINNTPYIVQYPDDNMSEARRIVESVVSQGIDLTEEYHDWIELGHSLNTVLGSMGEYEFHRLSSLYGGYDYNECHRVWESINRNNRKEVTLGTLIYMARMRGWG